MTDEFYVRADALLGADPDDARLACIVTGPQGDAITAWLAEALRAEHVRALEWALDAFMGGGYDELAFNECEEAVEKRIAELKAVSV